MKNFVIIGASGYIAPRHMKAIKDTGNNLIAVYDPYDGIGIIDSYFPDSQYFSEFERLDRYIDKLIRSDINVDYLVVCSPNYLHDSHIRYGLRIGANVICEKPIVLNTHNFDTLNQLSKDYSKKIHPILQLRLHKSIINLRETILKSQKDNFTVNLNYITSRGSWYNHSWKGDVNKSGGIVTNIGIHFFDILIWIFGDIKSYNQSYSDDKCCKGELVLKRAKVDWFLSINKEDLPHIAIEHGKTTFREISIDGEKLEFSDGFTELHTTSYHKILNNEGFTLDDAFKSIKLVSDLRK